MSPSTSGDGRYVAFSSWADGIVPNDTNRAWDVYVRDRQTGTTELVSVGMNGFAAGGSADDISADGRYVVFTSSRPDFVSGDDNGVEDAFLRDRVEWTTELLLSSALEGAALSTSGHAVFFASYSDDFVPGDTNGSTDVFAYDW